MVFFARTLVTVVSDGMWWMVLLNTARDCHGASGDTKLRWFLMPISWKVKSPILWLDTRHWGWLACLILIYLETVQLWVLSLLFGVVLLAVFYFNSLHFMYCTALVAFLIKKKLLLLLFSSQCTNSLIIFVMLSGVKFCILTKHREMMLWIECVICANWVSQSRPGLESLET